MAKYYPYLILLLVGFLLFPAIPAGAQITPTATGGPTPQPQACWYNTVQLATIFPTYPAVITACLDNTSWLGGVTYHDSYRCGQANPVPVYSAEFAHAGNANDYPLEDAKYLLFLPPSESYHPNKNPRIRFHLFFFNDLYTDFWYSYGDSPRVNDQIRVSFYTPTGYVESEQAYLTNYNFYTARIALPQVNQAMEYIVYEIDVELNLSEDIYWNGYGGFWKVQMSHAGNLQGDEMLVSSLQLAPDPSTILPPMCAISGLSITPTPAYPPTSTPGGPTFTPSPSPYPTSAATATARPWPTSTVRPYVTLLPEATATPYPLPTLQQIVWPTLAPINTQPPIQLTVEAVETTRESYYYSMTLGLEELSESWTVPLEESWGVLEITGTQTISSTSETVAEFTQYISFPIALFKSLVHYTPTTWPIWALLIAAVAWELLVEMIKVAIAVVATLAEYVRRLWESIPLN